MKKKINLSSIVLVLLCIVLLTSCVHEQPQIKPLLEGREFGFWGGLWHGIISPFMFIAHLFDNSIEVYAPNNNGGWYMFGFLLGAGVLLGGGSKASSSRR
jgi:hypothetical protein